MSFSLLLLVGRNYIENERDNNKGNDTLFYGEILAYEGKYKEAAKTFEKADEESKNVHGIERAIDMFTDLRLWDEARTFAGKSKTVDVKDLMLKQAKVCEESGDYQGAATIYHGIGQSEKAISLYGEHGDLKEIAEVVRQLDNTEQNKSALQAAAKHFRAAGREGARYAKETYLRLGDIRSLLEVHIDNEEWEEAISLARSTDAKEEKEHKQRLQVADKEEDEGDRRLVGKYSALVYLPYAEHLAANDQFEKAQQAYEQAGRPDLSSALLQALTISAVLQNCHIRAATLYRRLAHDVVREGQRKAIAVMQRSASHDEGSSGKDLVNDTAKRIVERIQQDAIERYHGFCHLADMHYAYSFIQQYVDAPFTPSLPDTLLQAAAFLVNGIIAISLDAREQDVGLGEEAKEAEEEDVYVMEKKLEHEDKTQSGSRRRSALAVLRHAPVWHRLPQGLFKGKEDDSGSLTKDSKAPPEASSLQSNVGLADTGVPYGISTAKSLYTLGKQAFELQAFRLARDAFERLSSLRYPPGWRNTIEVTRMLLQARPYSDPDEVLPACYKCGTVNQVLRYGVGDVCNHCGHRFARCYLTFDPLPLVEFEPAVGQDVVSHREALELLANEPEQSSVSSSGADTWKEEHKNENVQSLTFENNETKMQEKRSRRPGAETFDEALSKMDHSKFGKKLMVSRKVLESLSPSEVFVRRWDEVDSAMEPQYFKNMLPEVHIASCRSCWNFFHGEELETEALTSNKCPVCDADADSYIVWG